MINYTASAVLLQYLSIHNQYNMNCKKNHKVVNKARFVVRNGLRFTRKPCTISGQYTAFYMNGFLELQLCIQFKNYVFTFAINIFSILS